MVSARRAQVFLIWLLASGGLLGCGGATVRSAEPQNDLASRFFRNPELRLPDLSPDGTQVAGLLSHGQDDAIVVYPVADPAARRVVVTERRSRGTRASRRIRTLGWAHDDTLLYSIETPYRNREDSWERVDTERGRSSNESIRTGVGIRARKTRLYSTDLNGRRRWLGKRWKQARYSQFQHHIISWLPDDPEYVLVDYEGDALRVRVSNGSPKLVAAYRAGLASWAADHRGDIRIRVKSRHYTTETGFYYRDPETDTWVTMIEFDPYLESGFEFESYSDDPDIIYVSSKLSLDGQALDESVYYEYDLRRRALGSRVFALPGYSVVTSSLLSSPVDGRLLAIYSYAEGLEVHPVDPEWRRLWGVVESALPGQDVYVVSFDREARRLLLRASSDRSPPSLHLYDTTAGQITPLPSLYPALDGLSFAPMRARRYATRDGLEIEAFLTRPRGAAGPGPTIVMPHPGPDERDALGWHRVVQYLVHRGFSVFQPNYRGSVGYGSAHATAGDGEWGGKIQEDISDGVAWLIAEGIADPERVGIFGKGFGGYCALMGLVETPHLYRAGASLGGITDLGLLRSQDAKFFVRAPVNEYRIGDDPAILKARSPLEQADRIRAPVLLGHGKGDWMIHADHTEQMARALRAADVPVQTYLYKGATDRFLDDRDRIDFYRRLGDFFERNLTPGSTEPGTSFARGAQACPADCGVTP